LFFSRINQPELSEATEYLIQSFYGFESRLIKVTCQIEVSEQCYHQMYISSIEQYTHTIITNGYKRKTSVIITGSPREVCQARKLFDVKYFLFLMKTRFLLFLVMFTNYFDF
jgi:hypothetical protein